MRSPVESIAAASDRLAESEGDLATVLLQKSTQDGFARTSALKVQED
jgi:hypothetical protein